MEALLSSRSCGKALVGISGNKKGMALKGFHSILRVVIHKSVFVPDSLTHPAETKKVPKDCHVYTWYPLTLLTILNNVCPGSPVGSRNLPVGTRPADISGMSCLSPFPVYRCRIKINYGSILTQYKEYLAQDFSDYNLVLTLPNGRPVENRIMGKEFSRLREKAGLPYVVFHSLRHSSTTYKLKLNHGDLKATQGDTGHAQIDMITDVYAHILDEDRKVNAQKFEATFYAKNSVNPLKDVKAPENTNSDLTNLISALEQSPELVAMLTKALKGNAISS